MSICPNNPQHEWESVGNTERIDRSTISVEYECLNCGKTDYQYYEDIVKREDEEDE
jgi:hypothetical protein